MQYDVSPERTGLWFCKACGNGDRFIGVDNEGWPGNSYEWDHDAGCPWLAWHDHGTVDHNGEVPMCTCSAVLTQPVTLYTSLPEPTLEAAIARAIAHQLVDPGSDMVDYARFDGGVSDAEIGVYTKVVCGSCSAVLWAKSPDPAARA